MRAEAMVTKCLTVSQLHTAVLLLLPFLHALRAVLGELLAQLRPLLDQLLRGSRHSQPILRFELCVVLLQILTNVLLLLLRQ